MKAIRIIKFGSPADLELDEIPLPNPGPDKVLVRIVAASINPSDLKNVQGFMHQTTLPRTPGRDFAGTVVAGKADLIGTEVWGTGGDLGFTRDGSHAEYVLLPSGAVVKRTGGLTAQAAACCGVNFVVAAYGLNEAAIAPGQTVVVIGIFGGVGRAVAQIATRRGANVIGIAINDPPSDLPPSFGGISFINSSKLDAAEQVRKFTSGRGADIVYDTVGGKMMLEGLKFLAKRGRLIEISPGRDPLVTFNIRDFYHQEARLLGIDSLSLDANQSAAVLRELAEGFATGELTPPPIAAVYPLADAPRAYEAVAKGGEGRHVLVPEKN